MTGMAIAVTMLVEAVLERVQWAMGSRVGILLECVIVEMGVEGGLLGVSSGG